MRSSWQSDYYCNAVPLLVQVPSKSARLLLADFYCDHVLLSRPSATNSSLKGARTRYEEIVAVLYTPQPNLVAANSAASVERYGYIPRPDGKGNTIKCRKQGCPNGSSIALNNTKISDCKVGLPPESPRVPSRSTWKSHA